MRKITVSRFHDISCGHRVVGHEGKCRHLHGHNYRIHFNCESNNDELDHIGRVVDFSVIKNRLCQWLEDNWDHKFLAWSHDPIMVGLFRIIPGKLLFEDSKIFQESIVYVPFNPTAENMAEHLVRVVGPHQLKNTSISLTSVVIEETAKCSVTYTKKEI